MTDFLSEVNLLSARTAETKPQHSIDNLEDKEQVSATQITLKCGDAFLIADLCGNFLSSRKEMGLFRSGTRFLRTCNLYLEGCPLSILSHHVAAMGDACHIDLTNAPFSASEQAMIEQGAIHIGRFIELEQDYLIQTITVTNFHATSLALTLSLKLEADFCDLFEVRGFKRQQRGHSLPTQQDANQLILGYQGCDEVERTTHIEFEPAVTASRPDRVDWLLNLKRGEPVEIRIKISMRSSDSDKFVTGPAVTLWRAQHQPSINTDDHFFNRLLTRGVNDMMMLSTMTPQGYYPYAGIPWFSCPFGRDGLITALEFMPLFPEVARGALEFLAFYQGKKVDPFTEEEPGKIFHEFRTGEMANLRELPYIPYYGTIDATPLFIITLDAYIRWTNDLVFLEKLWPNVEAAARWLLDYGDKDGDSFIEYHGVSEKGLHNQGWKDAWDSISHSDGRIAQSPLALSEVQGYAYAAYRAMSYLTQRLHKPEDAIFWDRHADTIQAKFVRDFWWEEEQIFYQGLQTLGEQKEPCDVVSSNAGQCLWTGIVPDELASKVTQRLMQADMLSGWGIRTLSSHAHRFNPMSYHNGSVWPHDTALIGAGIALYGGKAEAGQILKSLFDASHYFDGMRLPELYCGFARREGYGPTSYPVSCSPQAWAAGAPFVLLSNLLGLQPHAEEHRLTLHQPTLPDWLNTLELKDLYVGSCRVHLRFVRMGERTEVVLGRYNEVDVRVL
jgi:glycogen debranching enzyme